MLCSSLLRYLLDALQCIRIRKLNVLLFIFSCFLPFFEKKMQNNEPVSPYLCIIDCMDNHFNFPQQR